MAPVLLSASLVAPVARKVRRARRDRRPKRCTQKALPERLLTRCPRAVAQASVQLRAPAQAALAARPARALRAARFAVVAAAVRHTQSQRGSICHTQASRSASPLSRRRALTRPASRQAADTLDKVRGIISEQLGMDVDKVRARGGGGETRAAQSHPVQGLGSLFAPPAPPAA
jgi:phosphoglycerate-specific signal transduction histidine kinase